MSSKKAAQGGAKKPTQQKTTKEEPKSTMNDNDEDDEGSGSEIEAEMELIYEDEGLRQEYEEAREWLEKLDPKQLLKASLFDENEIKKLSEIYRNNKPYPHLVIEDFIDVDFLDKIVDEIKSLEWKPKNNDLYLFHQSKLDLKATRSPLIRKLCQVLYSDEFVSILKKITNLPLFTVKSALELTPPKPNVGPELPVSGDDKTVLPPGHDHPDFQHKDYTEPDMFSAVYSDTCRLLCHDDELEGRRIAYIVYLTKEWSSEWGGHLDLFNHIVVPSKKNKSYVPTTLGKSYAPKFAQFAFFEVSETSFHQVREVHRTVEPKVKDTKKTQKIKNGKNDQDDEEDEDDDEDDGTGQRLSISGWYHGPHIVRQYDEYIPSSNVQIPPQNCDKMKPFVQTVFNQSGMEDEEIDEKKKNILQNYYSEQLIVDPKTLNRVKSATTGKLLAPVVESKIQIEDNIKFWVNKTYLTKQTQKQVMERFEEESCIDLVDFLKPSLYNQLLLECYQFEQQCFEPVDPTDPSKPACAIDPIGQVADPITNIPTNTQNLPIESVGPCNLRVYYRFNPQNIIAFLDKNPDKIAALPKGKESLIYKFYKFVHSKSFFTLINLFTGMKGESSSHELQVYRPGCYTLAHDNDPEVQQEGLDITFSLYSDNTILSSLPSTTTTITSDVVKKIDQAWDKDDFGGSIHYLVAGEDDELLSVASQSNTLSLVYRAGEEKIFQFQRYIDHRAPGTLYRWRGLMKLLPE